MTNEIDVYLTPSVVVPELAGTECRFVVRRERDGFRVDQDDLEGGEVWNTTPCMFFAALEPAVAWANAEAGKLS